MTLKREGQMSGGYIQYITGETGIERKQESKIIRKRKQEWKCEKGKERKEKEKKGN